MSFSIRQGNNGGLFRMVQQLPANIGKAKRVALWKTGWEMHEKSIGWVPKKTGDLSRSILPSPMNFSAVRDKIVVGTNKVYARIHDKGGYIKPHTRTSAFGRPTKPYQMPGRYQKPYKGRGYLTPSYLRMKTGRFRQIVHEEISAVLTRR